MPSSRQHPSWSASITTTAKEAPINSFYQRFPKSCYDSIKSPHIGYFRRAGIFSLGSLAGPRLHHDIAAVLAQVYDNRITRTL